VEVGTRSTYPLHDDAELILFRALLLTFHCKADSRVSDGPQNGSS
jgi:hypothetical protein